MLKLNMLGWKVTTIRVKTIIPNIEDVKVIYQSNQTTIRGIMARNEMKWAAQSL